jgi:hypothetical protein
LAHSLHKINVSGPLLKEKALKFAKDLNKPEFKVSNGWLEAFIKRNNIVFGTMSGERGDVDKNIVENWDVFYPHQDFVQSHLSVQFCVSECFEFEFFRHQAPQQLYEHFLFYITQ